MKPSIPAKQVSFVAIIALLIIVILVSVATAELFATTNPNSTPDYAFREEITTFRSSIRTIKSSAAPARSTVLNDTPQLNNSNMQSGIRRIPWSETEADTN